MNAMTDKINKANEIFETFDFGNYSVEDSSGWEFDSLNNHELNKVVFIKSCDDETEPTKKVSFTIRFDNDNNPTESFALLMSNGSEIGYSEEYDENTSNLKL
jgi:hypothetical protein